MTASREEQVREALEGGLRKIADAESGMWGWIAHDALKEASALSALDGEGRGPDDGYGASAASGSRPGPAVAEAHIWIEFEPDENGGMFVCGDEDGEFARAVNEATILTYVSDLIYGPGTVRDGGLKEAVEAARAAPGPKREGAEASSTKTAGREARGRNG
jgi:hypothetical protein